MLGGLIFLVLLLATLTWRVRAPALGWREAGLYAALTWGAVIALLTESLSVFHALRFWPVLIAWCGLLGSLGLYLWWIWPQRKIMGRPVLGTPLVRVLAVAVVALWLLAGVAAGLAPPNTPDVLSYHLPRQLLWLEQGGVQHFATGSDRLLMMSPLAEMIQVHALVLAGGDWWANVPQWLAYGWGMMVTSLLARDLGAGRGGQWLAAFAFATLPMAYLEASSAKNDLLVAVWLAIFTWLALRPVAAGRRTTADWLALGTALGLSLATKTTAVIFVVPVLGWLVRAPGRDWRGLVIGGAALLLIAGPHWARNQAWYGTPLGVHRAEDGGAQGNEVFSWRSVASNGVRNATLHLATPSPEVNMRLRTWVAQWHEIVGQDLRDGRTTLLGIDYGVEWRPKFETTAGAPAQAVLGVVVAFALLVAGPWRSRAGALMVITAAALLLYCLVLKWQPWGARLQLPAFVWLAALIAWWAERTGVLGGWIVAGVLSVGWIASAEVNIRPLWTAPTLLGTGRWENYFRTHPQDQRSVEACLNAIEVARVESLQVVFQHGFPYAFMRRYLDEGRGRRRLWMPGESGKKDAAVPSAVLVLERFDRWNPLYVRPAGSKERFRAVGATDPFGLYLPESRAGELGEALPAPSFVGWDRASGLGPIESAQAGNAVIATRRMTGPAVSLAFRVEAPRMLVRLAAQNLGPAPCDVELRLNGGRVASVRFDPGVGLQQVEVPLSLSGERGELTLGAGGEAPAPLVLTKLQIVDR